MGPPSCDSGESALSGTFGGRPGRRLGCGLANAHIANTHSGRICLSLQANCVVGSAVAVTLYDAHSCQRYVPVNYTVRVNDAVARDLSFMRLRPVILAVTLQAPGERLAFRCGAESAAPIARWE